MGRQLDIKIIKLLADPANCQQLSLHKLRFIGVFRENCLQVIDDAVELVTHEVAHALIHRADGINQFIEGHVQIRSVTHQLAQHVFWHRERSGQQIGDVNHQVVRRVVQLCCKNLPCLATLA